MFPSSSYTKKPETNVTGIVTGQKKARHQRRSKLKMLKLWILKRSRWRRPVLRRLSKHSWFHFLGTMATDRNAEQVLRRRGLAGRLAAVLVKFASKNTSILLKRKPWIIERISRPRLMYRRVLFVLAVLIEPRSTELWISSRILINIKPWQMKKRRLLNRSRFLNSGSQGKVTRKVTRKHC